MLRSGVSRIHVASCNLRSSTRWCHSKSSSGYCTKTCGSSMSKDIITPHLLRRQESEHMCVALLRRDSRPACGSPAPREAPRGAATPAHGCAKQGQQQQGAGRQYRQSEPVPLQLVAKLNLLPQLRLARDNRRGDRPSHPRSVNNGSGDDECRNQSRVLAHSRRQPAAQAAA